MASLVILGASGFVGRAVLAAPGLPMPVTAVSRASMCVPQLPQQAVRCLRADLLIPGSLDEVLEPGDVVANLAYGINASEADNVKLIGHVVAACLRRRVARLVHCSTAMVAGKTSETRVVESTVCVPRTAYERTKWTVEQRVLGAVAEGLDAAILRPTVIVGPGGRNLVKLADALRSGNPFVNYSRASLFGTRAMHLVPVRTVAAALLHVATLGTPAGGSIFNVSADEDPDNNFRSVETVLRESLGLSPRRLPLLPVPASALALLLRMRGRSDTDIARIYDSQKLFDTGFRPPESVVQAVRGFGASL